MAKAFTEQYRSHFDRMNKLVHKADNYFFPLDLTSTPLSWYLGFSFYYNHQVDSALVYFHRAEQQSPYHLQVLNDLGACYENKGMHELAIDYFDKALAVTPMYEETMLNKIVALYNEGKVEDAYKLLHARKYRYSTLYLSCKRTIIASVINSVTGGSTEPGLVKTITRDLQSQAWIGEIENKANGSFKVLQDILKKEFVRK